MEKEIVKEIVEECGIGMEKANFINLLIKICLDNEIINIKAKIKEFLV